MSREAVVLFQKILIAVDNEPVAAHAADIGAELARLAGAEMAFIHVVDPELVNAADTGIQPGHTFGTGDHHEVARWVELGLSPADAIVAATSRPAELLHIADMGTLAAGKSADFIVLDANPLEDIHNTRKIASVYLRGKALDRDALRKTLTR